MTQTDVLCFGESTGAIDLKVTDGTAPYLYVWSNVATTQDITGLTAGTYSVTITDANNCTITASTTITQPMPLSNTFNVIKYPSCYGGNDGIVESIPNGGTVSFDYQYNWNVIPTSINDTLNNFSSGQFIISIIDDNGCFLNDTISFNFDLCPPISVDDSSSNNAIQTTVVLNILANDTLSTGSTPLLNEVIIDLDPSQAGVQDTLTVAGEGEWVYNPSTGTLSFTPESGFVTDPSPIDYVLTETQTGLSDTANVVVDYNNFELNLQSSCNCGDSLNYEINGEYFIHQLLEINTDSNLAVQTDQNSTQGIYDNNGVTINVNIPFNEITLGYYTLSVWTKENTPFNIKAISSQGFADSLNGACNVDCRMYADLLLNITVSNPMPYIGDTVTFTITLKNNGPNTPRNIAFKNEIPIGFESIQAISNGGLYSADSIVWQLDSLNVGDSMVVTFSAVVKSPQGQNNEYLNIAQVTSSSLPDPNSLPNNGTENVLENDESAVSISIANIDLALTKVIDKLNPVVGDTVQFIITVYNSGPNNATNLHVQDLMPNGYDNIHNISNSGFVSGDTINWTGLSLANDSSIILSFNAIVKDFAAGIKYNNAAQIYYVDQKDMDSETDNYTGTAVEDDEALLCLTPAIVGDTSICEGETLILKAGGGIAYNWSSANYNSALDSLLIPAIAKSDEGSFVVNITTADGCVVNKTINVTVFENQRDSLYARPSGCDGDKTRNDGQLIVLNPSIQKTYQISSGISFNSLNASVLQQVPANGILLANIANPTASVFYTVRIYNAADCYQDYVLEMVPVQCVCPVEICIPITIKKTKGN